MKIVFMGTPDFAVPVLKAIIAAGHNVEYVITQPDKARNRGKKIQFTPVKEIAIENNIKVLQPTKIKDSPDTIKLLKESNPDIIVVVAYGQILNTEILNLPKLGCVNVHGSLLPKLRGASPIQHAILQGETETGITIMQMSEGLDTGDMLAKAVTQIGKKNSEELHDELSEIGAKLLVKTLPKIEKGEVIAEKQDDEKSSYAKMIYKADGKVDFEKSAEEIERQIRAFDPWPGAYCNYNEKVMKLWKAEVLDEKNVELSGKIINSSNNGIDISCGEKILRVTELQLPGKKRVKVSEFLKGNIIEKGTILG